MADPALSIRAALAMLEDFPELECDQGREARRLLSDAAEEVSALEEAAARQIGREWADAALRDPRGSR